MLIDFSESEVTLLLCLQSFPYLKPSSLIHVSNAGVFESLRLVFGINRTSNRKQTDARWYPASIKGIFVGQKFRVNDDTGKLFTVKTLGWDSDRHLPYFTADTDVDIPTFLDGKERTISCDKVPGEELSFITNKNNWGCLTAISEDHCANQGHLQTLTKYSYGQGDMFASAAFLYYQGNIMSAQGDEGGVAYTAEIIHDLRIFRGTVKCFELVKDNSDNINIIEGILTYTSATNAERLGSCRPIINLNQKKWIKDGTVRIYISNTFCDCQGYKVNKSKCDQLPNKGEIECDGGLKIPKNTITHGVIEGIRTNWTMDVVGRYFAVDEPCCDANDPSCDVDKSCEHIPLEKPLYRWYRIVKLDKLDKEIDLLFVEVVRWGVEIGAPDLVDPNNYFNYKGKELNYIIAPGAVVSDVSKGVNENDSVLQNKLILQPNGDFGNTGLPLLPFAEGDEIEQAIGPSPWNPTGFRVRHFNNFPSLIEDSSFSSVNLGTSPVHYGLSLGGGSPILDEAKKQYRRGGVAYKTGIFFNAVMQEGIRFHGDIKPFDSNDAGLAIVLRQQTGNKKVIAWTTRNEKIYATIGFDPDKENYYLRGAKAIEIENASLNFVRGISGTRKSANNLCEVDVPVMANSNELTITFNTPEIDPEYAIQITPSWLTICAVTGKTKQGFKVLFGTPPSQNEKLDWFLTR